MPLFKLARSVARTPEQVFAVLDDLQQAPTWMPRIRKVKVLTPDQPVGVGYAWEETSRILGFIPFTVRLAVAVHDPPRRWGVVYDDGKVRAEATFRLTPIAGGTHIDFTESVEDLQGKPKRAEATLRRIEKMDRDLLERLARHLEATTPAEAVKAKPARQRRAKGKASKKR